MLGSYFQQEYRVVLNVQAVKVPVGEPTLVPGTISPEGQLAEWRRLWLRIEKQVSRGGDGV